MKNNNAWTYSVRMMMALFWALSFFGFLYTAYITFSVFSWSPVPTINVLAWSDIFDREAIAVFEKETGIKVNMSHYSSNEELLVKLKATRGVGYDLVVPSDYAVELLCAEGLLQPLDKNKLTFLEHLNPLLLDHPFDRGNKYSIPFEWEIFGIGIDTDFFKNRPYEPSWELIFKNPLGAYTIAMSNDSVAATIFAAQYLFGQAVTLNDTQVEQIRALLALQRAWVCAYVDFRADYFLATKNCPVVTASTSYILRSQRLFSHIGFVIPKEGSFITIENCAITVASHHVDRVYAFINFLYRPDIVAHHFAKFALFPATTDVLSELSLDDTWKSIITMSRADFEQFSFLKRILPEQQLNNLWISIKS